MATYIDLWQAALRQEIYHLKKFGTTRLKLLNGRMIQRGETIIYYFETVTETSKIPIGSTVTLHWGIKEMKGTIRSSEGRSVIVELGEFIGDLLSEVILQYDPWELLDQLHERLEETKEDKQKQARMKRLMKPSLQTLHPVEKIRSSVHELVLRSKYNPITFVWGPPGTGKTYTLARVAANHCVKNKRVLILSQSNQAIDVLMIELYRFLEQKKQFRIGQLLRYGSNTGEMLNELPVTVAFLLKKKDPSLADQQLDLTLERKGLKTDLNDSFSKRDSSRLLEIEEMLAKLIEKIRKTEHDYLKKATVIATTLAKAATDPSIYEAEYDYIIVDEVSMAYVPQLAFAVSLGKKAILCGDFKQLSPIAHSKQKLVEDWLKVDIFHKVQVTERLGGKLHPQLFLLDEQRRMHPDISSFTNQYIYESLVKDHSSVRKQRELIASRPPFSAQASILIDSSYSGEYCLRTTNGSRTNIWHLLLSFQLIHESWTGGSRSIGYTTPYRAQAEWMDILLRELYPEEMKNGIILPATVHKFQGSEREVMVFDTVDSFPQPYASMLLTGKDSERLINVAMTRTKGKFLHISDTRFVKEKVFSSKTIRQLTDFQIKQGQVILPEQIGHWVSNQHPYVRFMHAKNLKVLVKDLEKAKKCQVFLPKDVSLSGETKEIFKQMEGKFSFVTGEWTFPFIIIEERILWLGVPFEAVANAGSPHISIRVYSPGLVKAFVSELGMKS